MVVCQPLVGGFIRLSRPCGQDGDFLELENDVLQMLRVCGAQNQIQSRLGRSDVVSKSLKELLLP